VKAVVLHESADDLPDALKPGIHGARAHWNRDFMAFQLSRRPARSG
jgi:hypothetical protein